MSPAWETALRSLGVAIITAVLLWASNNANLVGIVSVPVSLIIASLAGMLDKALSPNGTVLAGTIG